MKFGDALELLKTGRTVTRAVYATDAITGQPDNWKLSLVGGTLVTDDGQSKRPWLASHDCLLAGDWELVAE